MYDLSKNYEISRKLASGGMILLKNEEKLLPLRADSRVGIVGKECLSLLKGGGGSSQVKCEYVRSLEYGILEKAGENKFGFYEPSLEIAQSGDYTLESLNLLAREFDTALVTYKRDGCEGRDRVIGANSAVAVENGAYAGETDQAVGAGPGDIARGFYYPSARELDFFTLLEKSDIKSVILILNISSIVDISFIERFKKIKAVLLCFMPGMESGTAIADVLCGDVDPSGRLVDTIAYDIYDYPSTEFFDYDEEKTEYKEGIFVGYRYFETMAKEKVLYPFGYGLSYTEFEFSDMALKAENGRISVSVKVKNIGLREGREVVQIYASAPDGKLRKPVVELRGFAKTGVIKPDMSETVKIEFSVSDMASFDNTGETGFKAAWVLEEGEYEIFAAKNVRERYSCGIYKQEKTEVVKQLALRFKEEKNVFSQPDELMRYEGEKISLYDVDEGKATLEEFISQLTTDELLELAMGQPPAFPNGTAGIGNLKKYAVPNIQTADGPAGVRRSLNSTCFPCATLIASSWDSELQLAMGEAMGEEAYSTGIDVILAPGLNIHRNPLCGRNFEYYSEDPLISGLAASNMVNGIQSKGVLATVKHFAANNCEFMRRSNDSIVDERTLREIYLRGFEIVVKRSNPAYIMTSYNKLNGYHASANISLLRGVLREEWGYEGCIMTDWRNLAALDDELIAGNNIKMPFGYPDQNELAKKAVRNGKLSLAVLQENAKWVLLSVMKSRAFKQRDFGAEHIMKDDVLFVSATETESISSTRVMQSEREDRTRFLYSLNRDQRGQRTFVCYSIWAPEDSEYSVSADVATNSSAFELHYSDDEGHLLGIARCKAEDYVWHKTETVLKLKKGRNSIRITFTDEPSAEYEFVTGFPVSKTDIRFAGLDIKLLKNYSGRKN